MRDIIHSTEQPFSQKEKILDRISAEHQPNELTDDQLERYARHAILDEIGETGQARLLQSRVCIVGAGGLGSPVLMYLAAAGIGTLGIVDPDRVDRTNLQRQIAHTEISVGEFKTSSAVTQARALNSGITYKEHQTALDAENAEIILGTYDLVVDGTDVFSTRCCINAACHKLKIPLVSGSVMRFEGQVATFKSYQTGPCYQCLFDREMSIGIASRCDQAGILGPVAGIIGTLQALEVVKVLLDLPGNLVGRMLMFDAQDPALRVYKTQKKSKCPICMSSVE